MWFVLLSGHAQDETVGFDRVAQVGSGVGGGDDSGSVGVVLVAGSQPLDLDDLAGREDVLRCTGRQVVLGLRDHHADDTGLSCTLDGEARGVDADRSHLTDVGLGPGDGELCTGVQRGDGLVDSSHVGSLPFCYRPRRAGNLLLRAAMSTSAFLPLWPLCCLPVGPWCCSSCLSAGLSRYGSDFDSASRALSRPTALPSLNSTDERSASWR